MISDQKVCSALLYTSYELAHTVPEAELVVVDCHYPRGLVLAHLYEDRVPEAVRSNTSTDCALKALDSELLTGRSTVTCNHWDIDGFLAVWSLLNPEQALANAPLLTQAAMLGDFREFDTRSTTGDSALKLCALLNAVEAQHFCLPFGDLEDATIEYEVAKQKFDYFLPRFAEWLENIDSYTELWKPEYDRVREDLAAIARKDAVIEEDPERGISIVTTARPLHYYSICSSIEGGAILTLLPDRHYAEFEYRYETRVGRLDKRTIQRRDLSELAERLTQLETAPGIRWTFDNILLGGPMLRPEHAEHPLSREECYQSMDYRLAHHPEVRTTIDPALLRRLVLDALA